MRRQTTPLKAVAGVLVASLVLAQVSVAEDPSRRIPWTTSDIKGTPEPPPPYALERVFGKLAFKQPVYLTAEPGTNRLMVVEQKGRILAFDERAAPNEAVPFLALSDETYSMAFHPKYVENGTFFVFRNLQKDGRSHTNRISRFQIKDGGGPRKGDPKSEIVLLEWGSRGHNGGDLAFGPDAMLYITAGDGETGVDDPDPGQTGQSLVDLRGGILRIDVDHQTDGKHYAVPNDNPFVGRSDARPELWAFGLRNPWRFSFDLPTGVLYIGDNGEESWESIYIGKRGANYGWSVLEGSHAFNLARKPAPVPFEQPIAEHPHAESRSIMGGRVYRGGRLPKLAGVYVYGDHETGKLWGLRYDNGQVTDRRELASTGRRVIAFGAGHPTADQSSRFPRRLSQTGLYRSTSDRLVAAGVIPYAINAPAWADGAFVKRHLAVPGNDKIKYQQDRGWEFGSGAVLVQTMSIESRSGDPASRRPIETRLLHNHEGNWQGYSYRWNDQATDAELADSRGENFELAIQTPQGVRRQSWQIPSRAQCMVCHSFWGPRFVIGVSTAQMNRAFDAGSGQENQIDRFTRLGLFENAPQQPAKKLPKLVDPHDETLDLAKRARSYLHANCAHCHRYSGTGNARMRLDVSEPDDRTKIFNVSPEHGGFDLTAARLVAPGHAWRSVLVYRMAKSGRGRMPQIISSEVDVRGLKLLSCWIEQLEPPRDAPPIEAATAGNLTKLAHLAPDSQAAVELLDSLLARPTSALALAQAIDRDSVAAALADVVVARGAAHRDRNVRDLFERFLPADQRSRRLGSRVDPQHVLALAGDAVAGRKLFFEAAAIQCRTCHAAGRQEPGSGPDARRALGPDLSRLAKRYTRVELLESLLEPSKRVDPKYQAVVVETADGRVFQGLLAERTGRGLVLVDGQNRSLRFSADEIEAVSPQAKSLMPDGLLRDLTAQEAADLLEFVYQVNAKGR